jgi:hypothetical protein
VSCQAAANLCQSVPSPPPPPQRDSERERTSQVGRLAVQMGSDGPLLGLQALLGALVQVAGLEKEALSEFKRPIIRPEALIKAVSSWY